jgi:putative nucleotidyltransferase with HDIG domain
MLLFLYTNDRVMKVSLYRVKQFIWGIGSLYKKVDYEYVGQFLTEDEINIFKKLKRSDQHHCVRVCKDSIQYNKEYSVNVNEHKLGKAALLHDVGKGSLHLSLIEKSIIVILDKITKGNLRNHDKIKQVNIYYNHPKIGFNILKNLGYENDLLDVIRYHHKKGKINCNNKMLQIISICDDKN